MRLVRFSDADDGSLLYVNPEHVISVEDASRTSQHEVGKATRLACLDSYNPYVLGEVQEVAAKLQWADVGRP